MQVLIDMLFVYLVKSLTLPFSEPSGEDVEVWGIDVVNDPGLGLWVVEEVSEGHPEHSAVGDAFHGVWSVLEETWSSGFKVKDTVGESGNPEFSASEVEVEGIVGGGWESIGEIVLSSVSEPSSVLSGDHIVGDNPSLSLEEVLVLNVNWPWLDDGRNNRDEKKDSLDHLCFEFIFLIIPM